MKSAIHVLCMRGVMGDGAVGSLTVAHRPPGRADRPSARQLVRAVPVGAHPAAAEEPPMGERADSDAGALRNAAVAAEGHDAAAASESVFSEARRTTPVRKRSN